MAYGRPGRPKKEETEPTRPFNHDEPHGIVVGERGRMLAQGGALYTYAESTGVWSNKRKKYKIAPEPQFLAWQQDHDKAQKLDEYRKLKAKNAILLNELEDMEKDLKSIGLLGKDE